jgi:aminocarboxymuconate-semialdehyde decarboxylase
VLFHNCGSMCGPQSPEREPSSGIAQKRTRRGTVDFHCHILIPAIERLVATLPEKAAEVQQLEIASGPASSDHNRRVMLPVAGPKLTSLEVRLKDMDAMGVDRQVISPTPTQYYYWTDRDLAAVLVKEQNEAIAAACAKHPDRLSGLGNVSLQHADLAPAQLEYLVRELGLKGVEISSSVNGGRLVDETLAPFWQKANDMQCVVFIHPFGTTMGARLNRYYLSNLIGQPLETAIALSELIFSGTLDRCDKVKIVAAHGGGYLPTYIGRSDHGFKVRPEAGGCKEAPHEYLKRIWFDSVVYDGMALRHLIDRVGASQVVVGTDYPFDMGDFAPHELISALSSLTELGRDALLRGNALGLLGLPHDTSIVAPQPPPQPAGASR